MLQTDNTKVAGLKLRDVIMSKRGLVGGPGSSPRWNPGRANVLIIDPKLLERMVKRKRIDVGRNHDVPRPVEDVIHIVASPANDKVGPAPGKLPLGGHDNRLRGVFRSRATELTGDGLRVIKQHGVILLETDRNPVPISPRGIVARSSFLSLTNRSESRQELLSNSSRILADFANTNTGEREGSLVRGGELKWQKGFSAGHQEMRREAGSLMRQRTIRKQDYRQNLNPRGV